MKKIVFISMLTLFSICQAYAQEKAPAKYMIITIYPTDSFNRKLNMIVTREDTAQLQTKLVVDPHVKLKDFVAAYESLMLKTLKPYFDNGWKLVSSNVQTENISGTGIISGANTDHITRFYLSKED